MGTRTRVAVVAALGAVTALGLAGGPAGAARVARRCDAHRAYEKDAAALVYRQASGQDDGVGNSVSIVYACARPNGRSLAIAADSNPGGEYLPNDDLRQVLLGGRWVASLEVQGEGDRSSCQKYGQSNCPTPVAYLRAAEVRTRRMVTVKLPWQSRGVVLASSSSTSSALAWLEPATTGSDLWASVLVMRRAKLVDLPRRLDTGKISGVSLRGWTLTWLDGSVRHQAHLAATG